MKLTTFNAHSFIVVKHSSADCNCYFFVVVAVALMTVKVQVTLNVVDLLLIRIGNWLNVRRDQSWWKLR